MKKLIAVIMSLAAVAVEARVVYNGATALRSAYTAQANPYTDAHGGVWAVYARTSADAGTTTALSGFTQFDSKDAYGVGAFANWNFVLGTDCTEPTVIAGSLPTNPGEINMHPGSSGTACVVLRFTAPRAGRYSVSSFFHTLNVGSGKVGCSWLFNNVMLKRELLDHSVSTGSTSSTNVLEHIVLNAGDTLEFAVDNGDNSNGNDATALSLSLVEEEELTILASYDAHTALSAMIGGDSLVNPHADAAGANWSLFAVPWCNWIYTSDPVYDWTGFYGHDNDLLVLGEGTWFGCKYVQKDASNNAWCRIGVNTTGGMVNMNKGGTLVCPKAIMVHPGLQNAAIPVIRFKAPVAGTYLVTATARHNDTTNTAGRGNGVAVALMAGGDPLAAKVLNCVSAGGTPGAVIQQQTPVLEAGEEIDCLVDCVGDNADDTSYLVLNIFRLENSTWKGIDIGKAVNDQFITQVTTSSFTGADGTKFSTGWITTGSTDAMTAFTQLGTLKNGDVQGVTYDSSSWVYLLANMTRSPLAYTANDSSSVVRPREFLMHPGSNKDPALRIQVGKRATTISVCTSEIFSAGTRPTRAWC